MTNREVYDIVNTALTPQYIERKERHKRFDITVRIGHRDIRIMSNYKHTKYDVIDADTGEIIAIQSDNSLTQIDAEWWNNKCTL